MPGEAIVTVRMPAGLVKALKARTERDHYTDLSEQVRSIVRRGCFRYTNPVTSEIKELKSQLKAELAQETEDERAKALLAQLRLLIDRGEGA